MYEELLERTLIVNSKLYPSVLKCRFIHIMEQAGACLSEPQLMQFNCNNKPSEEQIQKVREMSWQQIAEAFYQILDDMSSLDDKYADAENHREYRESILRLQSKRNNYLYSPDGYDLKKIGEAKLKEKSISHMNANELMVVKRYWESVLLKKHVDSERKWLDEQLEDLNELLKGKPIEDPPYTIEPKINECVCHIYGMKDIKLIEFYNKNNVDGWGTAHNEPYGSDRKEVEVELNKRGLKNHISEGTVDHATRELKLAGMFDEKIDDDDSGCFGNYNTMIAEAVIELMKVFSDQDHSGMSAGMVRELFNKLSNFERLTELTDSSEEWMDVSEASYGVEGVKDHPSMWQSNRAPASFSTDGGKTYYNLDILAEKDDEIHPSTRDLKLFTSKVADMIGKE